VNAAPPAVSPFGLSEVMVGAGLLTVKVFAVDVPPPGAGLVTVTLTDPAVVTSAAGTVTTNCVELCDVSVSTLAPKFTMELAIKFVPVSVIVTPAPNVVLVGLIEVRVGATLLTVKVCAVDVPPPGGGLVTVTLIGPAVVTSAAGTVTWSDVADCEVGFSTFAPKFTVEPLTKFVPVSVMVTPVPTVVLVGLIEVNVGVTLLTVKVCAVVVPPPGPGLVTVTLIGPAVATSVPGTVTWSDVADCEDGFSTFAPKFTVEPLTKFVPVSVIVTPVPTVVLVGLIEVSVGAGLLMVKVCADVVPPPGAGFVTVTLSGPAAARSAVVIAAVNSVELTKVAVGATVPNFTVEPLTKFVPVNVRVKAAPPTVALVGEIELRVGTTLFTVKSKAPFVPPAGAGLLTTTGRLPAVAISGAVTDIVTCVEETGVTVVGLLLNVPVAPFTKFEPLMVNVNAAPPAVTLLGENEESVVGGLSIVKLCAEVVPPPGAGLVTVTFTFPPTVISAAGTVTCRDVDV